MPHFLNRIEHGRQVGVDIDGDQIRPRRHNLCGRPFAQFQNVLDHLLFLLVNRPLHPMVFELFQKLFLQFLLLGLGRRNRNAGQTANEAVIEL